MIHCNKVTEVYCVHHYQSINNLCLCINNIMWLLFNYVRHCYYGGIESVEVDDAVNKFFTLKEKPDAILCTSDKLTTGCLGTLIRRKLRIPEDIALLGFSNTQVGELLSPPLTVVRQPASDMGRAATELLLQLVESKRPVKDFEKRVLSPELIIRSSSLKSK